MFELKIDGIFGLGPPRSEGMCGFESPLFTAYQNKLIDSSIFTVYMHNSKDAGSGEYGGGKFLIGNLILNIRLDRIELIIWFSIKYHNALNKASFPFECTFNGI